MITSIIVVTAIIVLDKLSKVSKQYNTNDIFCILIHIYLVLL